MSDNGKPAQGKKIIPLPLVIGVTGHRDLREEDRAALETQVCGIFVDLQSRYPYTPLVLLSPLAEGADRLVAKVALERGVRLIVPLPMPRELYEQDFQTGASRDEFDKLLEQAERWFELPLYRSKRDKSNREGEAQDLARDQQYAQVGAYITLHSQILIALWDGKDTHKEGGTSQIVQLQLEGVPGNHPDAISLSPLDEPENGPVYHIVTPRINNATSPEHAFQLQKIFPASGDSGHSERDDEENRHGSNDAESHDASEQEFDRILKHLDTFNREGTSLVARLNGRKEQSRADLFGDLDTTALSPELKVTLDHYADLYATADTLAIHFRDRTINTLRLLFSLFFISLIFFDVFAHLNIFLRNILGDMLGGWLSIVSLLFYLIILSIAYYVWHYRATKGDYKNKYLDYRALAEGLRVQFFWRVAGLHDTVANHYLRKQKSELDWIRNSIRVANLLSDEDSREALAGYPATVPGNPFHMILSPWVHAQSKYFTDTARRDHERLEGNERWVRRFFLVGIVLAVALLILQFVLQIARQTNWLDIASEFLIVFTSLALVFAALREGFADKMAYAEQAKQYQRMSRLFWQAFQKLSDSLEQGRHREAERVIRELGEEALAENGDWVILHRARPLNVPMGG